MSPYLLLSDAGESEALHPEFFLQPALVDDLIKGTELGPAVESGHHERLTADGYQRTDPIGRDELSPSDAPYGFPLHRTALSR